MNEHPLQSIADTIACDVRDWSDNKRSAWIFGIVHGWDRGSLKEFKIRFKWSDNDIARLKRLNRRYKKLMKIKCE